MYALACLPFSPSYTQLLVDWPVVCLVGWLVVWLVGWLVGGGWLSGFRCLEGLGGRASEARNGSQTASR